MNNNKIVTRFAPSPTGFMHIGGIRTAIFAYLWARKNKGTFILRIEDTDKKREVSGSLEHIIECLNWLSLDYDFGPNMENPFGSAKQSERLDTYTDWAKKLLGKGFAYPDPYSEEDVENWRKECEENRKPFLYREHRPNNFSQDWDGKTALRFKVPEIKRFVWHDEVRGELTAGEEALDDFILMKADGYPTYNFAHIIDDYNMGVNCIIRGEEFISSTPKFLSLYDALGFYYPAFVTVPSILREDRTKKLGKRDGAKDVLDYRNDGILPEAIFNFLTLIGFNPGGEKEIFSKEELIEIFDIKKIQKAGGVFNEEKLLWMNGEYIKKMDKEKQLSLIIESLPDHIKKLPGFSLDKLKKVLPEIINRIERFSDVGALAETGELSYYFDRPDFNEKFDKNILIWKDNTFSDVKKHLSALKDIFEKTDENIFSEKEEIKRVSLGYAEEAGKGNVLWPLRVTLSGREKSSDPFFISSVLGKEEVLERLKIVIQLLG